MGDVDANIEIKTVDASGNPYLALAALLAAGASEMDRSLSLPDETVGDPAKTPRSAPPDRLPASSGEAVAAFEKSGLLRAAFGDVLFENYLAVRVAEHEWFASLRLPELIELHRWRY